MDACVVTVTLNPAVDKTIVVPRFRPERVVRVKEAFVYPSGKGVNVARALVRLGAPALCLGFVGGYAGAFLRDALEREGIPHDFTSVAAETRINLTLRDPESGLEVHFVEAGAPVSEAEWQAFLATYERHLPNARWIALCGSLPPGVALDSYAQLIRRAREGGVLCALDTSGDALRLGVQARPDLVKPNRQELAELVGKPLDSDEALLAAVEQLLVQGIRFVVVSLGKEGAIGSDGKGFWKATPPLVPVVNTVGSGDALLGGMLFGLLKGLPFSEALRFAVAVGTANTLVDGPAYIDAATVSAIVEQVSLCAF